MISSSPLRLRDMKEKDEQLNSETADLVKRAQSGDHDAILALFALYEKRVISEVRHKMGIRLRTQMESVDLVQSLWGEVVKDIRDFEYQGPNSFLHWLNTCLLNKIRAKGRYYKAEKRNLGKVRPIRTEGDPSSGALLPPALDPTPSQEAISREEQERFSRLLKELPALHREVLKMRLKDQLKFDEIGQRIGKSSEATRKICGKGLAALKKLFEREEKGDRDRRT